MHSATLLLLVAAAGSAAAIERWDFDIEHGGHRIPIHMLSPSKGADGTGAPSPPWPLVLWMHGDPCEWWWYEYVAEYLVPAGYVVGLMASYEPAGSFSNMATDMRVSLDTIYTQAKTNATFELYGKLSYKAAAGGHSAGSIASLLTMGPDKSYNVTYHYDAIAAFAPLEGLDIREAIIRRLSNPKVLMLAGSSDCICPAARAEPIFHLLPSTGMCKYYGEITNGTHCDFADITTLEHTCFDVEASMCNGFNRPIIPKEAQLGLSKNYLLLFLNAALKADAAAQKPLFDSLNTIMQAELQSGFMTQALYNCSI